MNQPCLTQMRLISRCLLIATMWIAGADWAASQVLQPGDVIVASEVSPDSIRVYDGATGSLKAILDDPQWTTGGSGRHPRIAPDGSLWVNNPDNETMFHYDANLIALGSFSLADAECTPNHIRGFAVAPDGSLFVTTQASVLHVDGSTGTVLWCTDLGVEPVDNDMMANGQLCVSTNPDPSVRIVDAETGEIVESLYLPGCNVQPNAGLGAIRSLPNGLLIVSEPLEQRIVVLDPFSAPGEECLWSIPVIANQYPYVVGADYDLAQDSVVTLAVRDGTYWLEKYDFTSGVRLSSVTTDPPTGPLPPPTNAIAVVPTSPRALTAVGPARIWVGLKNGDDVGIKFDFLVETYLNSALVASGQLNSAPGGSSGFNNAKLGVIPITLPAAVSVSSGDAVRFKLYVRNAAVGSGKNSGTARLWYDDVQANSRIDVAIDAQETYHLRSGSTLSTAVGAGPKKTIDVQAGAKGSPFKLLGEWALPVP